MKFLSNNKIPKNGEEAEALVVQLGELRKLIAAAEESIDAGEERLKAYMEKLSLSAFETNRVKASISEHNRTRFDTKRFKAEKPRMYARFQKVLSCTRLSYSVKA